MDEKILIREAVPGDPSMAVCFYFKLFREQYDFYTSSEGYFMEKMIELFNDPEGNRLFVAEKQDNIVGSLLVLKRGEHRAQLRMFGIDPALQGKGIGTELFKEAINFCKEKGYTDIYLWTVEMLKSARHMYEKNGFRITDTKVNKTWAGYEMLEEEWSCSL